MAGRSWRSGADLGGAELAGRSWLGGAGRSGADLGGAELAGRSWLGGAGRSGADLGGADLGGAELAGRSWAGRRGQAVRGGRRGGDRGTVAAMASLEDVARMTASLPEVTDGERHGNRTWFVRGKAFAWDRPFSKADIRRFGDEKPPDGPILAVSVADLGEKEAVLAAHQDAFFTIPHFDGYAAILIRLGAVGEDALREALTDGWLAAAPAQLAADYISRQ